MPHPAADPAADAAAGMDVAHHERNEALLALNAAVLERIVLGTPLPRTLDALTVGIEELSDGMLASVLLLDSEGVHLLHGSAPSLPTAYNEAIAGIEIGVGVGSCGTAAFTGEQVVVEDVMSHPYWEDFRDLAAEHHLRACWSTPIRAADGAIVGTFALYYREPRAPTAWHEQLIEAATRLARAAIEHDRARRGLAASEQRFRTVATNVPVGIFQTDLDSNSVYANPALFDILGCDAARPGGDWPEQIHPDDLQRATAARQAGYSDKREWVSEHRIVRPDGSIRWVNVHGIPLRDSDGDVTGFVGSYVDVTEAKDAEERRREFEREHLIAQTLQESLLTERLPDVPGVEAAARYVAGEAGLRVGGDWYDVFALPGGRLGIAVGDVVGRGLDAATTMGQLRSALRALAWTTSSPGRVIHKLSELAESDDRMATLIYGIVDPSTRTLHYASAGHPPPLVAPPDADAYYLEDGRNPPLGLQVGAPNEAVAELAPESLLVLYTDGLVERRDAAIDDGLSRLKALVRSDARDLEALCDEIIRGLAAVEAGDDIALISLRLDPLPSERLELALPNEPKLLRAFRASLRRWLETAGAAEREAQEIVLAASEAVGNAITHAHALSDDLVELRAHCEDEVVAITVCDRGQWRVLRREAGGRGIPLMQSLMDDVEIDSGASGTRVTLRRRLGAPRERRPLAPVGDLGQLDQAVSQDAGVAVVALEREVDLSNAHELELALQNAVTNRHRALVVDMSECHYIDSGGLAVLFAAAQRLASHRQEMRLAIPEGSPVLRAIALTGLDAVAPRSESVDEAVAAVGSEVAAVG